MTGGSYSVFRFAYGAYLCAALTAAALGGRGQAWAIGAAVIGALAAIPFAIGFRDRIFAIVIAPAVLVVGMDAPSIVVPVTMIVPLVVHLGLRPAPYGSLDARGRPDPAGDFSFPPALSFAIYAVLAGAYAAIAMPMVRSGAPGWPEWVFAACAATFLVLGIARPARFAAWALMLVALGLQLALGDHPLVLPLFFVHLFAFDGTAVPPRRASEPERVFYDGSCGLCHRAVRFALAEDPDGEAFRFAPLGGEAFEREVPEEKQSDLPDSIVLLTSDGELLVRSAAILRMMAGLGGLWRVLGALMSVIPQLVRDLGYDFVARIRHRLFAKPKDVCPIIPKHLRPRFEL